MVRYGIDLGEGRNRVVRRFCFSFRSFVDANDFV